MRISDHEPSSVILSQTKCFKITASFMRKRCVSTNKAKASHKWERTRWSTWFCALCVCWLTGPFSSLFGPSWSTLKLCLSRVRNRLSVLRPCARLSCLLSLSRELTILELDVPASGSIQDFDFACVIKTVRCLSGGKVAWNAPVLPREMSRPLLVPMADRDAGSGIWSSDLFSGKTLVFDRVPRSIFSQWWRLEFSSMYTIRLLTDLFGAECANRIFEECAVVLLFWQFRDKLCCVLFKFSKIFLDSKIDVGECNDVVRLRLFRSEMSLSPSGVFMICFWSLHEAADIFLTFSLIFYLPSLIQIRYYFMYTLYWGNYIRTKNYE